MRVEVRVAEQDHALNVPPRVLQLHGCHFGDDALINRVIGLELHLQDGQRLRWVVGHQQAVGVALERLDGERPQLAGSRRRQADQLEEPLRMDLQEPIDMRVRFHPADLAADERLQEQYPGTLEVRRV